MTISLIQASTNVLLVVGAVATLLSMIVAIVKLYSDNKANIRNQAQIEQRLKNESSNNKEAIARVGKDMEKLELRISKDHNNLIRKFDQMETKIEARLEKLSETLIDILKGE